MLLALPGVAVALLAQPAGEVVLRGFAGFLVGLVGALVVRDLGGAEMVKTTLPSAAMGGVLALVAAGGFVVLVGEALALLLGVLVALTSPVAGRCYVRFLRARLRSFMTQEPPVVPPSSVPSWPLLRTLALPALDDRELAAAWQQSSAAVQHAGDAEALLGWVLVRRSMLDELERRHLVKLGSWAEPVGSPLDLLPWRPPAGRPGEPEVESR